jgi:nicotinate-nucleotide--dimethylbenzimidazole phosphoribosyltransferase
MTGTKDFTLEPAMTEATMLDALELGRQQVNPKASLFIGGDMGIGNTTSASAIYSLLLKLPAETTVGPGTGVDKDGLAIKRKCLYRAFNLHANQLESPLGILQHVGGLEIAGLAGSYIACAQQGIPILVDGFITTAAALLAVNINPSCRNWMLFAHKSAEPAHKYALKSLDAIPILDLGMRLGEGSGAGVAVSLIKSALALHANMATFANAGVSES